METFYVTVGRGIQKFAKEHLEVEKHFQICNADVEGKIFFAISRQQLEDVQVVDDLFHLKFAERLFAQVDRSAVDHLTKSQLLNHLRDIFVDSRRVTHVVDLFFELHNKAANKYSNSKNAGNVPCKRRKADHVTDNQPMASSDVSTLTDPIIPSTSLAMINVPEHPTFRLCCKVTGKNRKKIDDRRLSQELGTQFAKSSGFHVDLRNPDLEIAISISDAGLTVGIPLTKQPVSRHGYVAVSGLRSTVCDVMLRLADLKADNSYLVLDPMCGTATILIEALARNSNVVAIGCDMNESQMLFAHQNKLALRTFGLNDQLDLIISNIRLGIPLADESVDVVLCDLPFGKQHLTKDEMKRMLPSIMNEILRVAKTGAPVVLLFSVEGSELLQKIAKDVNRDKKRMKFVESADISLGTTDGCISSFIILHDCFDST